MSVRFGMRRAVMRRLFVRTIFVFSQIGRRRKPQYLAENRGFVGQDRRSESWRHCAEQRRHESHPGD